MPRFPDITLALDFFLSRHKNLKRLSGVERILATLRAAFVILPFMSDFVRNRTRLNVNAQLRQRE